jgi:hypothetical protein
VGRESRAGCITWNHRAWEPLLAVGVASLARVPSRAGSLVGVLDLIALPGRVLSAQAVRVAKRKGKCREREKDREPV